MRHGSFLTQADTHHQHILSYVYLNCCKWFWKTFESAKNISNGLKVKMKWKFFWKCYIIILYNDEKSPILCEATCSSVLIAVLSAFHLTHNHCEAVLRAIDCKWESRHNWILVLKWSGLVLLLWGIRCEQSYNWWFSTGQVLLVHELLCILIHIFQ